MASALDPIDRHILRLLRADGRTAHAAIAKEVGLSGPAVHERVRKLEQNGVIQGTPPSSIRMPSIVLTLPSRS